MRLFMGALGAVAILFAAFFANAEVGLVIDIEGEGADLVRRAIGRELALLDPAPRGTLTIRREAAGSASIVYLSEDGRRIERTIDLESDPVGAADEIALVAASLMRDEPAPPAPPPPAPAPAPPRAAPSVPAPTRVEPSPSATRRRLEVGRADPCRRVTPLFPFTVDLLPFVGTSSSRRIRGSTRALALNVMGGVGAGLEGFEVGGALDIETDHACGVEVAGVANIVTGDLGGLQVASVLNLTSGHVRGAEVGGGVNIAGDGVEGAQIGVVNIAKGRVRGVQIGVVNVAEKSDFSLGVVSINYKGRTQLDLWSELEVGLVAFAVKHGGDHWHSFYGIGTRLTKPTLVGVLGVGSHVRFTSRVYFDVDLLGYELLSFSDAKLATHLFQARPIVGVNLIDQLALFAGPSFNVLFARKPAIDWSPGYGLALDAASVHMWPGATLGLQALAD